jgi:hypothetical protein
MRVFVAMALAVSLASWGAAAQETPAQTPQAAGSALVQKHQRNIGFVSGGSSLDDRASLAAVAGQYNMRLTFAVQGSGEYLSGVDVSLADADGKKLLDAVSDGPLFYAQLPPGHYRLTVASGGQSQTRDLSVAATGVSAQAFYWRQAG